MDNRTGSVLYMEGRKVDSWWWVYWKLCAVQLSTGNATMYIGTEISVQFLCQEWVLTKLGPSIKHEVSNSKLKVDKFYLL